MNALKTERLTWNDLVKIEPRLETLYRECLAYKPVAGVCYLRTWYKVEKPKLLDLVGFFSKNPNPDLKNCRAYDLAYEKCVKAMSRCSPGCHRCRG